MAEPFLDLRDVGALVEGARGGRQFARVAGREADTNMAAAVIRWTSIRALYDPDLEQHRTRAREIGLEASADVFEQLFHEPHQDPVFALVVQWVDWAGVTWREIELSGLALSQVHVPREYERAVEEARARTIGQGLQDERPEVVSHWHEKSTWFRAPVLVTGDVADRPIAYELLVGFTRLGNLLGLIERGEVASEKKHRVWVGSS